MKLLLALFRSADIYMTNPCADDYKELFRKKKSLLGYEHL